MIEINLLPEELRIRSAKSAQAKEKSGGAKKILYLVPAVIALLLIMHIYFLGIIIFKNFQLAALNYQWLKLEPERKRIENMQKEYSSSSVEFQTIEQITAQRLNLAQKLKSLSYSLPSGIWFNELSISEREGLSLKGSVVSLAKEEVGLLNKFIDNLKSDKEFYNGFDRLELSSVTRRSISNYEVIDFVLMGEFKK